MKQIIPFKKELPFKTKVCDITSISLERDIDISDDGIVSGVFHITGDYKMNEGSINREDFSFDLPFDITLDPRYDIKTVNADIEDFYYDIINEDTLKVNIDLFIEADYLPESEIKLEVTGTVDEDSNLKEDDTSSSEDREDNTEDLEDKEEEVLEVVKEETDTSEDNTLRLDEKERDETIFSPSILFEDKKTEELPIENDNMISTSDLFSNLDDTETYSTYYVYIVKEDDSIDKILSKYGVTKEELEDYNDITEIKPGDKVIVPKKCE